MANNLQPYQGMAGDALAQADAARTRGTACPDEQRRDFWDHGSSGLSYAPTSKGENHGSPMQTVPLGTGRRLGMGCNLLCQEEAGPLTVCVQARRGAYLRSVTCISTQGRSA